MAVLVDTGIFFGFYSKKDKHHMDSIALLVHIMEGKWGVPYISEHILNEILNLLKYRISPDLSVVFIETFINSKNLRILPLSESSLIKALDIFVKNHQLKGFSFTDAISIVLLREYNIQLLITYDRFLAKFAKIVGPNYFLSLPIDERNRILNLLKMKKLLSSEH